MTQELVFGFDIGTTSIGSAVIRMDSHVGSGDILHLGVRIFPEARDPDGIPLNQERRQKRLMRRQLRRRRKRRRDLNTLLSNAGLLPSFSKEKGSAWAEAMKVDPWFLRTRATQEKLSSAELGRVLYHVAQRRHFRGRDLEEGDTVDNGAQQEVAADEKVAANQREADRKALKSSGLTLGSFLATIPEREQRRRGHHFLREDVYAEYQAILQAQAPHHPQLAEPDFTNALEQTVFDQKPVFWRKATLGHCRFVPDTDLAASASWLAQEKRMLEKLNNLRIEEGNGRPLDEHERAAILTLLRKQDSATWAGICRHLKLYWRRNDLPEKPTFNLQRGGEKGLTANRLENRLAAIMGDRWSAEPGLRDRLRQEIHARIYAADYGQIGGRIIIRREAERRKKREEVRNHLLTDFELTDEQADALAALTFAPGWEPFSAEALKAFLPRLQQGALFGALLASPEEEAWRAEIFPNRLQPTGAWVQKLPTPGNSKEEAERQKAVRNPTVLRVQNELRKVVNNLISVYGHPDRIRVEVAREVGKSARDRAEDLKRNRSREKERKDARADLVANDIAEPTRSDIEKWLLWQECRKICPYTGRAIGFDALFKHNEFQIEHIWPRWRSFDDSFVNKTLCHRDFNLQKSNRTPFEAFADDLDAWEHMVKRVRNFDGPRKLVAIKAERFTATSIPEDFASRQLNDTGYAARQAVGFLKQLYPDLGQMGDLKVATLSGRVTATLRHHWGLNDILSVEGVKTRADHRHHAIDALVAALAHPGYTQILSRWFQRKDDPSTPPAPRLDPPFPDVRDQAKIVVEKIIVSHRARRKVSGPLHKDTTYGDGGSADGTRGISYRWFTTRKPVETLTKALLADDEAWPEPHIHKIVRDWIDSHGGDPKKAFAEGYPTVSSGGAPIRKVRIRIKQQERLMAKLKNGYADLGNNHHTAIFRASDGKISADVISLFEAADRLRHHKPVIARERVGATFLMSLAQGDMLHFPTGKLKGLWVVQGVWSSGQIILWRAEDATGASVFRPTAASIIKEGGRKISVDPIGRIRPARD